METSRPTRGSSVRRVAAAVPITLALFLVTAGGVGPATVIVPIVITGLAIAVSIWALLRARRQRLDYEDRLATWAGERAAQAERLRIASDLHDLVSHGLGLITVRAAAAARVAEPGGSDDNEGTGTANGDEQAVALADIERIGRETTAELRRMLTVLRTPESDPAPRRPAETLLDLPAVVQAARDAGLHVTLDLPELSGLGVVSPGAQLTVCAVVREALGNTLRHAGPTRAHVSVRRNDGALVTTVHDDGPAIGWQARPGAGHGLTGLRERVAALGGTLHAASIATPAGGFTLTADLPDETNARP